MAFTKTTPREVSAIMLDRATGAPLTTAVSVFVRKDGASQAAAANTPNHEGNGEWSYLCSAAEWNGDAVHVVFVHATGVNQIREVFPDSKIVSGLNDFDPGAQAVLLAAVQAFNNTGQTNNLPADVKLWLAVAPLALAAQRVVTDAAVVSDKTGYQIAGTLNTLDQLAADLKALIHEGTAQAAANHASENNGQITLAAAAPSVDVGVPVFSLVFVRSGPGAGQVRAVRSYTGATKIAITVPAWQAGAIPNGTSTYEVFAAPLEIAKLIEPQGEFTFDVLARAILAYFAGEMEVGLPTASDATFKTPEGDKSARLVVGYSSAPDNIDRTAVDLTGSK